MSRMEVSSRPAPLSSDPAYGAHRNIPILPSSTASNQASSDNMDITPPSSAKMPPPKTASPETEQGDVSPTNASSEHKWGQSKREGEKTSGDTQSSPNGPSNNQNSVNAAIAAQSQQPKVVQTAFIHKLYNMLEDQSISHLISWSNSGESFVMAPTHEFSKVLSQYFKHTNISSFVRQLNMYGFHKVSDVFHTAGSETMWEFKHGNGSFKRGDTASLRDIKRRASRHSLISRDTFHQPPPPKHTMPQPGAPAEPAPEPEHRLTSLEFSFQEIHNRLIRTEDVNRSLSERCQWLADGLHRQQSWNNELCQMVMKLVSDRDSPVYRDAASLQREITTAQYDVFEPQRHQNVANDPISPRQVPIDDRRSSMSSGVNQSPYRPSFTRPPVSHNSAISPRRYGSISGAAPVYPPSSSSYSPTTPTAAGSARPPLAGPQYTHPGLPQPHAPHPLSSVAEPGQSSNPGSLARRHTSADIRANEGWQQAQAQHQQHTQGTTTPIPPLPPLSSAASGHWPSSPIPTHHQSHHDPSTQELRNTLNSFEFGSRRATMHSRPNSPPAPDREMPPIPAISGPFANHGENGGGWSFQAANNDRPKPYAQQRLVEQSAPPTRRSSLANNNLHNLLNPADTAERMEEDDGQEERKRKRMA